MKRFIEFLEDLALLYDPSKRALQPPNVEVATKVVKQTQLPDGTQYSPTMGVVRIHEVASQELEWEKVGKATGARTTNVTEEDMAELKSCGLDLTKAAELKRLWASGASAAQASQNYSGRRGFSQRSLAPYWAAFSRASGMMRNSMQTAHISIDNQ